MNETKPNQSSDRLTIKTVATNTCIDTPRSKDTVILGSPSQLAQPGFRQVE
ncbi:MAG: hypothetical protein QNJ51_12100 [Calothrix sp. MO_167.B12]|nr:hypothetical protein [Calothrix sp. MO_167.B12]